MVTENRENKGADKMETNVFSNHGNKAQVHKVSSFLGGREGNQLRRHTRVWGRPGMVPLEDSSVASMKLPKIGPKDTARGGPLAVAALPSLFPHMGRPPGECHTDGNNCSQA